MIGVLHGGAFDGAEFDLRNWGKVPEIVFARAGGEGPQGVQLSQNEDSGGELYALSQMGPKLADVYHYANTDLAIGCLYPPIEELEPNSHDR